MTMPTNDEALFRTVREKLFTAVIGDVMDAGGLTRQFLPHTIRALQPDMVVVGRAMTVLEADCSGEQVGHSGRPEPFGLMFRALDSLTAGDVYITTGASPRYALWGGLMSTRARAVSAAASSVGSPGSTSSRSLCRIRPRSRPPRMLSGTAPSSG